VRVFCDKLRNIRTWYLVLLYNVSLYIYIRFFKKGSIGTVIEATSRKDRKWKVSLDNDTKEY